MKNKIISDFGDEWEKFDQINLNEKELLKIYNDYFDIFPWEKLTKESIGIDIGCGSGRWSNFTAERVKSLTLLDGSSKSIKVSKKMLKKFCNINYLHSDVNKIPIKDSTFDFAYSLGVLHHVPQVDQAMAEINRILKPGAPFLIYLYYLFDNKPYWYKLIWLLSDFLRKGICKLPNPLKMIICELIAMVIYLPLSRMSHLLEKLRFNVSTFPLSYYRNKSFYTMRTDSLDRFGTTYEKRYSKIEIKKLLSSHGFECIKFSSTKPYWCALAYKVKKC